MAIKQNKITIVGCGPGGADYLTAIARREIDRAEVLVGAPRLLDAFPESRAKRIPVGTDIAHALDRIAGWRARCVVVLVTGDPGLCSFAQPVIRRFGHKACCVIPGISAVQAAFAAIGADWLDARIVTAHSRAPAIDPAELAGTGKIAVLAGHNAARPWLAELAARLGRDYRIFACQNLTLPEQSVRRMRAAQLRKLDLSSRNVILFIRREELSCRRPIRLPPSLPPLADPLVEKLWRAGRRKVTRGTFYGIGVGPGDSELITVKGARILAQCRNVFVPKARLASASVALNIARRHVPAGATIREIIFPMTQDPGKLARRWRSSAAEVAQVLRGGLDACFLTLGDPLLYSTYIYLLRALQAELPGLNAVTVPGITSFCAAAALTNFALGEGKAPVTIVPASDDLDIVREALRRGGTVVLMKIGERLRAILGILKEQGLLDQAVLVARAGQDGQRVATDLRKLKPGDSRAGYLAVILVHADGGTRV